MACQSSNNGFSEESESSLMGNCKPQYREHGGKLPYREVTPKFKIIYSGFEGWQYQCNIILLKRMGNQS